MRTRILMIVSLVIPLVTACNQQAQDAQFPNGSLQSSNSTNVSRPRLVQDAAGAVIDGDCMAQNGDKIAQLAQQSAESAHQFVTSTCDVKVLHQANVARGITNDTGRYVDRDDWWRYGYGYGAVYYPQAYCYNNYVNGYFWGNLLGTYNYNYNPMSVLGYSGYNYYPYSSYPQYYNYNYYGIPYNYYYYPTYGSSYSYYPGYYGYQYLY